MLESWQIPILVEAVDFLFDVGRLILNEIRIHREQRKATLLSPEPVKPNQVTTDGADIHAQVIASKEEALKSKVEEARAKQKEAEIQHLLELIRIYTTSYRNAEKKRALWGENLVPAVIINELEDAEKNLSETIERLKATTEWVFAKKLTLQ